MRFFSGWFFYGASMSLEGMRRTLLGGSFLCLFLVKEFGLSEHSRDLITFLEGYLELEASWIEKLPPILNFLMTPWRDHNKAGRIYLEIYKILVELEFPETCEFYWPKP